MEIQQRATNRAKFGEGIVEMSKDESVRFSSFESLKVLTLSVWDRRLSQQNGLYKFDSHKEELTVSSPLFPSLAHCWKSVCCWTSQSFVNSISVWPKSEPNGRNVKKGKPSEAILLPYHQIVVHFI